MITRDKVLEAMQCGWIFVCAMCNKLWEGVGKDLKKDGGEQRCTSLTGCASPSYGGNFHDYKGVISNFEGFCYVCGAASDHVIHIDNCNKKIGVCKTHLKLVNMEFNGEYFRDKLNAKKVP